MTIDENFSLVKYIIKKNLNGDLSDASFNLLINQAQYSYLSHLLGDTETYQNGRPIARVELGNNQSIAQKLSPFIETPSDLTVDVNGHANFPTGFICVNAMYKDNGRVKWVKQDNLYSHLESVIDPIATNPIYLIENGKFQFYPRTLASAQISYVKSPRRAKWDFDTDANGRHTYKSSTSVDLLWSDIDQFEIISRVLRYVGVSLQSQQVQAFANQTQLQGQ